MNVVNSIGLAVLLCCGAALADDGSGQDQQLESIFAPERIAATGQSYQATVPDTLDLADRARLAVNGLTESLNPEHDYRPYGHAFFNVQPPYMTERMYAPRMDAGAANWGKIMEALVLMRSVCGSRQNLDLQAKSLAGMVRYVNASGCPYQNSRAIMALMALYRANPSPELRQLIELRNRQLYPSLGGLDAKRVSAVGENEPNGVPLTRPPATLSPSDGERDPSPGLATLSPSDGERAGVRGLRVDSLDGLAWYEDPEPYLRPTEFGIFNYETQTHQHGCPIWALCQWFEISGNTTNLLMARRMSRFLAQPRFWQPEVEPRFFVGSERAHFKGHVHSYLGALLGLAQYARLCNDPWLKEFVRNGYEYVRNLGIARLGVFGETCVIAEMTILAAELSEMGIADYWEHVDQYVRNHLAEMQFTDLETVTNQVARMPSLARVLQENQDEDILHTREDCAPGRDTTARMVERNLGTFFTDGGHPALIPRRNWTWTICCVGNGAKGLFYAWKSIVQFTNGVASINLLLNRASPWVDVDSYLPYEGRVVIRNKTATKIAVRLPLWVEKEAVTQRLNGRPASPDRIGNYLVFNRVANGDSLTLEFPVVETMETYTLKWRQTDRWFESNWPPDTWQPGNDRYVCRFRGNTLVEIRPESNRISEGLGYPLYQRAGHRRHEAPMKQVTRFISGD